MLPLGIMGICLAGTVLLVAITIRVLRTDSVSTSEPCADCQKHAQLLVTIETEIAQLKVRMAGTEEHVANHLRSVTQRLRRSGQYVPEGGDDQLTMERDAALAAIQAGLTPESTAEDVPVSALQRRRASRGN